MAKYSVQQPSVPMFDYGDTELACKGNATLMNELQLLQNKAVKMKIIPSFYFSTEVLHALCQSTLVKRRLFHRCLSFFLVCE